MGERERSIENYQRLSRIFQKERGEENQQERERAKAIALFYLERGRNIFLLRFLSLLLSISPSLSLSFYISLSLQFLYYTLPNKGTVATLFSLMLYNTCLMRRLFAIGFSSSYLLILGQLVTVPLAYRDYDNKGRGMGRKIAKNKHMTFIFFKIASKHPGSNVRLF